LQLLALGLAQVERDRLLVPADHRPPQRLAARLLPSPDAHRVALARRFDLDDLCAHVAQQLAAEWARQQRAQFQDPHVGERTACETRFGHAVCIQSAPIYRQLRRLNGD